MVSRIGPVVIDQERELLQVTARTLSPPGLSPRLDTAYAALIDGLTAELADWIAAWAPAVSEARRAVIATLGLNGLLGARLATSLFRGRTSAVPDEDYLSEWSRALAARIEAGP